MKRVCFGILLVCMILYGTAVLADEANETATVELVETIDATVDDDAVNSSLLSSEAAAAFAVIDQKVMMVTEEAFDYLLRGNESAKEDYLSEYASLESDFATFETFIDTEDERYADLMVEYDNLIASVDSMGAAAETMFASYETEGTVSEEEVVAFEKQVDLAIASSDAIWQINRATQTGSRTLEGTNGRLISTLLEAIEESYAYPVTGDVTEKEDALARFADFDTRVANATEAFPDISFEDMKSAKADLMTAAEAMFASYDAEESVTTEEVEAFEEAVETFTAVFIATEENQGKI